MSTSRGVTDISPTLYPPSSTFPTTQDPTNTPTTTTNTNTNTTTTAAIPIEVAEYLNERNLENVSRLGVFLAYVVVLMLVGLAGNGAAFAVYLTRFRPSGSRTFILSMSLCDLMTNVWALVTEVMDVRFHYTFHAAWFCKLSKTLMGMLVLFSGLVLVGVAVERHKVVCGMYTRHQSRTRMARLALLVCFILAVGLSLPRAFLYGRHSAAFNGTDVVGVQCSIQDHYLSTLFPVLYNSVNALVFVVIVAALAVCYGRLGVHLFRHKKRTGHLRRKVSTSSALTTPVPGPAPNYNDNDRPTKVSETKTKDSSNINNNNDLPPDLERRPPLRAYSASYQPSSPTNPQPGNSFPGTDQLEQQQRRDKDAASDGGGGGGGETLPNKTAEVKLNMPTTPVHEAPPKFTRTTSVASSALGKRINSRTTLMLFVLTAVFVVNFLPYLVMEVTLAVAPGSSLWRADSNLLYILFRSYYLNSAVNPVVYSLCSAKFRYECRELFRNLRSWLGWRKGF
ncbi:uncharacterized protein LOC143285104 [Babylonia areolata]|uniref:uncharacterized protein LOC143285104 n=1 Tax=Babylonia areolata TaxID=304850 RepID=UPI003FD430A0